MKSTFAIACMAAVATVDASVFDALKSFPVTKADARKKYGNKYQAFKTTPEHQKMVADAHMSVRAQRVRLGMAPIAAGRQQEIRKSYEDMTGFSAAILGMAQGLMYNAASGPNKCFTAVEGTTIAGSNLFYVLTKSYMPWYLPEAQLVIQDNIALIGGFYTDCDVNKFFDSMTTLFSSEGISAATARGSAAYLTTYGNYKKVMNDPYSSTFVKGEAFGKIFGSVTNYHI